MPVQSNPSAPTSPPVTLAPGWYWYQWPPEDAPAWRMAQRANAESLQLKREYVSADDQWGMAVFLVRSPLQWRMRGTPTRAPRGESTVWDDVLPPQQPPRSYLEHYVANGGPWVTEHVIEPVGGALDKAGSAANFLLWGGVAVLLVNVWRTTSPRAR